MAKPVLPTIPVAPTRTRPNLFSDEAEAFINFLATSFINYVYDMGEFVEEEAAASLAAAVAGNLSGTSLSSLAGRSIGVNAAGTALEGKTPATVSYASQAQAEAGTVNNRAMSPLRTKQAIDKFAAAAAGRRKLATLTANYNSTRQFFTQLDSTKYHSYEVHVTNLRPFTDRSKLTIDPRKGTNATASTTRFIVTNYNAWRTDHVELTGEVGTSTNETGVSGIITIYNLHADTGAIMISRLAGMDYQGVLRSWTRYAMLQRPSTDTPVTAFNFRMGNLIQSGTLTLYGLVS